MNLDKKALAGFIKEIEDSRDRQKGETEFQRDVFKRARKKHFDVKALRIVLQRRAMDTTRRDEQDYNVHAYELALGAKKLAVEAMEQGATAREAAKAHGLPRAAVTALKPGAENEDFEPDHANSEINPGEGAADAAKPVKAQAAAPPEIEQEARNAEEQDSDSVRQAAPLRREPNTGNAGAGSDGVGRLRAGQDDAGEDGGRVCREGTPKGELTAPGPQEPAKSLYQRITGAFAEPSCAKNAPVAESFFAESANNSTSEDRGERAAALGAKAAARSCTLTNGTPAASIPLITDDQAQQAMLNARDHLESLKRSKGVAA